MCVRVTRIPRACRFVCYKCTGIPIACALEALHGQGVLFPFHVLLSLHEMHLGGVQILSTTPTNHTPNQTHRSSIAGIVFFHPLLANLLYELLCDIFPQLCLRGINIVVIPEVMAGAGKISKFRIGVTATRTTQVGRNITPHPSRRQLQSPAPCQSFLAALLPPPHGHPQTGLLRNMPGRQRLRNLTKHPGKEKKQKCFNFCVHLGAYRNALPETRVLFPSGLEAPKPSSPFLQQHL